MNVNDHSVFDVTLKVVSVSLSLSLLWNFYQVCVSSRWLKVSVTLGVSFISHPVIFIPCYIIFTFFYLNRNSTFALHQLVSPLQISCVDRHQWIWLFFVQPYTNHLIMRSICGSDNKCSTFTLILGLGWHRQHHIAELILCPMSRHPKSNLLFYLEPRYCSCQYTCWLLTLPDAVHTHTLTRTCTSATRSP